MMGKVRAKRCRQCDGCRAPACQKCSKCKNKKACENKRCTMEIIGGIETKNSSEMLSVLAFELKECKDDDQRILTMQKLIDLDLSALSLGTEEVNCVGREARTMRGTNGEVGVLAVSLLAKWKKLGWSEWADFLHNDSDDSDEECDNKSDLEDNKTDNEGDLNITNMTKRDQTLSLGQNNNERSQKTGRAKLNIQKRTVEEKFKKLITKRPGEDSYECKCGFLAQTKARASRHAEKCTMEPKVRKAKKKRKNRIIKCNLCQITTKTENGMLEHRKSHPELRNVYKCRYEDCPSVLNNAKHLKEHLKTHQAREKLPCPCCKKKYCQTGGRNRHILEKHKNVLENISLENETVLKDLQLLNRIEATGDSNEKNKRSAMRRLVGHLLENKDKLADLDDSRLNESSDDGGLEGSDESGLEGSDEGGHDGNDEGGSKGDDSKFDQEDHNDILDEGSDSGGETNVHQEHNEESFDSIGDNEEEESKMSVYEAIRFRNMKQMEEMRAKIGFDEFKEKKVKGAKKKKVLSPKPTLPTRRSKRLNVLYDDKEDESKLSNVLAPELCDLFSQAIPIPVRQIRELPKYMRSKPMPTAKIPSQCSLPPLPIRFYSSTPIKSFSSQECVKPDSPLKRIEEMTEYQAKKSRLESFQPILSNDKVQKNQFKVAYRNPPSPKESFQNWRDPKVVKDQSPLLYPSHNKSTNSEDVFEEASGDNSNKDNSEPDFLLAMLSLHLKDQHFAKSSQARRSDNIEIVDNRKINFGESEIQYTFHDPVVVGSGLSLDDSESYKCDVCPFNSANDNKDLRRHIEKMHKEKEGLICPKFWCGDRFRTRYDLNEHRKNCKETICQEEGCSFKLKWKHQVSRHKRWHITEREKQ